MKKSTLMLEIFVGLLALIIGIITLYPFKFFNIPTAAEIMVYGIIVLGVTMLVVGVFRLYSIFSNENLGLAKKINAVTSVLTIAVAVVILYFQMVTLGERLLHFLFGIGLLSYAVGRVTIGALTTEYKLGLRAFISSMGIIVGVFSIIIILFQMVRTRSEGNLTVYLTYGYFTRITLIVIGVDCLVSAILGIFLSRQKQCVCL